MGTPDFAVPSLEILLENKYKVCAVVTAPDKPQGRGRQTASSPVKASAVKHNIPVLQPEKLKDLTFLNALKSYNSNLFVVVAFRMLPEVVWSIPEYGTFNLHASLLPQYRGAAPINWALINDESETGVTTFFITHEIDKGSILLQEKERIHSSDDAGSLHDRLMLHGAELVLKTVRSIEAGPPKTVRQPETNDLKKAPKIFRDTCQIDWNAGTTRVLNFIRGLSPYPGAWTTLGDRTVKIFKAIPSENFSAKPGTVNILAHAILVKTGDGAIAIEELQAEGRKRMSVQQYLAGIRS